MNSVHCRFGVLAGVLACSLCAAQPGGTTAPSAQPVSSSPLTVPELKSSGAFGFQQKSAVVLCDNSELRVAAVNDGQYLFVQAVLWNDSDDSVGSTDDGRKIGDWCNLAIDCDADGKATPEVDREYSLNPWPSAPGLHYCIVSGPNSNSGLTADSKGRGSIQYVAVDPAHPEAKTRVDSLVIPLSELSRKPGEEIRFAYWASSPKPELVVNSVGFTTDKKKYWSHNLPREKRHVFVLKTPAGVAIDLQQVPEGRGSIAVKAKKPAPKVGERPPEIASAAWLNWEGKEPPTLESLRGKVVVVEFWATWCGPCVAGIPHLNDLHGKYAKDGLAILSLTDQERKPVEEFVKNRGDGMRYTIGVESSAADDYGVSGIPRAFVVGRDGKLAWEGHPAEAEFEKAIEGELKKK